MDTELLDRIHRLHVAIDRVEECDLSQFPAKLIANDRGRIFLQDFSGGLSEAEMSETLHALIHNIASFHDHLQNWGDRNGVSRETIHNYLKDSLDFCVVRDLWNNDKHGYPPTRGNGWSRKAPRLFNAHGICRLQTGPEKNSSTTMTFARNGQPVVKTTGGGSVRTVLTGEVVDKNGGGIGDAYKFIEASIRVCEAALQKFVYKP